MSNFRTKILGLAALATAFAGMSYGQVVSNCTPAAVVPTALQGNPTLRAESETELVSDVAFANTTATACANTVATTATIYLVLNAPVTAKSATTLSGGGASSGNSDIVLTVGVQTASAGPFVPTYYPGTVSGLTVTFANVALPVATFGGGAGIVSGISFQTSNVRVNASAASAPQVTASLLITYAAAVGSTNISEAAVNVGYVLSSLTSSLGLNGSATSTPTINSYTTCGGNSLGTAALVTSSFVVNITQLVAGAWRQQGGVVALAGENGSFTNGGVALGALPSNTGISSSGTQINLQLANLPSAATIYVPLNITMTTTVGTGANGTGGAAGTQVMTLAGAPSVATSPAIVVGANLVALTPTNGALTISYVVGTVGTGTVFAVPVRVAITANAAPVQTSAVTELVSYGPATALAAGSLPLVIPQFAVSATAPTNTFVVNACATTLLFPFVTNQNGFETGIAIANTTTDNLKVNATTGAISSSATPTPGTCTINFYGATATQPTAFVTPTIGAYSSTNTNGPVYAATLTSMSGATNFEGYAIASCTFLDAHGFGYIVDNFGTTSGVAEGFLAIQIATARPAAGDGVAPVGNGH
jgi:hypothetical protein